MINSAKVAKDLLDRRSASYSDRPHMVSGLQLICELLALPYAGRMLLLDLRRRIVGYNENDYSFKIFKFILLVLRAEFAKSTPLQKYDEPWKQQRKIIAQEFSNSSTISRYWPLQEEQARLLVNSLLQNPRQMRQEVSMYGSACYPFNEKALNLRHLGVLCSLFSLFVTGIP